MRIKFIAVLLAVIILLMSACSKEAEPSEQTEAVSTANAVFRLEELPDIGEYKPKKETEYFYSAPLNEYKTNAEYKSIFPYMGAVKHFKSAYENSDMSYDSELYGLAASDGKIITSAVYNSLYGYTTFDGSKTYYVGEKSEIIPNYISLTDYDEEYTTRNYDIISADGLNFFTVENIPYYMSYSSNETLDSFIFVNSDSVAGVYSVNGKKLFEINGRAGNFESGTPQIVKTETGYIYIITDYTEGEKVCFIYLDNNGNKISEKDINATGVFGIYGGLLILEPDFYTMALCDYSGNIISEEKYSRIEYSEQRKLFVCVDGDNTAVNELDTNGNVIRALTLPEGTVKADCYTVTGGIVFVNDEEIPVGIYSFETGETKNIYSSDAVKMYDVSGERDGEYCSMLAVVYSDGSTDVFDCNGNIVESEYCKTDYAEDETYRNGIIYINDNYIYFTDTDGKNVIKSRDGNYTEVSLKENSACSDCYGFVGDYVLFYENVTDGDTNDWKYRIFYAVKGEYIADNITYANICKTACGDFIQYCDNEGVIHNIDENGNDLIKISNASDFV